MAYCKTCSDEIPEGCSYCVSCMNDNKEARGQADTQKGFEDYSEKESADTKEHYRRLRKKIKDFGLEGVFSSLE